MAEHSAVNRRVVGSNPTAAAKLRLIKNALLVRTYIVIRSPYDERL